MSPSAMPSWRAISEQMLAPTATNAETDRALKRALRANPHLSASDRNVLADVVLGTSCLRGRLRYQLEQAGLPTDARHLTALYLLDERGMSVAPDVSRAALSRTSFPQAPAERLAAERSLPTWLAEQLVTERGYDDADALAAALNRRGPITARVNTLKTTRAELKQTLGAEGTQISEGELSPWALQLEGRPNIRGSAAWRDGLFEVQDEGSQLIALATGAEPGDLVIDLCAGRGGKALALAAMLQNEGRVIAHDVDERRLDDLLPRRARAGASCIEVLRDARALPRDADVVLVDAPCSETGALRRGPHKRWLLDEDVVASMPKLQLEILEHARSLVKPGGRLVYATCSLLKSENEEVVAQCIRGHMLDEGPRLQLVEARELTPHEHGTDGFYIAVLRPNE